MKLDYLLLSCCAPCSVAVIEFLKQRGDLFAVVFYNPNIYPESEYIKRRDENKRVCDLFKVPFIEIPYDPDVWFQEMKGFENCPERGDRCALCFRMRLRKVAEYAAAHHIKQISSVLGVSRYKDWDQVLQQAQKAVQDLPVTYDQTPWRKGGLETRRSALIKQLELYQQTYCGCVFSKKSSERKPTQNQPSEPTE